MGTDIHMYVETRDADGKWRKVGRIWPCDWNKDELTDEPYDGRNYDLFAILANVRNGYGFAGAGTGCGFRPISRARGLPADLSPELQRVYSEDVDDAWLGDHSYSWLTLRELQECDWSQQVQQCGVIRWPDYLEHRRGTEPNEYAGAIWSRDSITIDEAEAERGLPHGYASDKVNVTVHWTHSYRDAVGAETVDRLLAKLADLGAPDDVRIVFGFDS